MRRIKVTLGFVALLSASAYFGSARLLTAMLTGAAVHELGHLAAMRLLGCRLERLTLSACGAELSVENRSGVSFRRELILCLSGPATNLLLVLVLTLLNRAPLLLGANLLLGAFNLLPLRPLDGGNALFAAMSLLLPPLWAERLTLWLSRGLALLLLAAGICLFRAPEGRPWLLLMGLWLTCTAFARAG